LLGFASLFLPWEGAPGFAAAALSLAALVLGLQRMPETLTTGGSAGRRRWLDWHGLQNVLRTPSIGSLVVTFFLATLAFGGLESTLALVNRVLFADEIIRNEPLTRDAL